MLLTGALMRCCPAHAAQIPSVTAAQDWFQRVRDRNSRESVRFFDGRYAPNSFAMVKFNLDSQHGCHDMVVVISMFNMVNVKWLSSLVFLLDHTSVRASRLGGRFFSHLRSRVVALVFGPDSGNADKNREFVTTKWDTA